MPLLTRSLLALCLFALPLASGAAVTDYDKAIINHYMSLGYTVNNGLDSYVPAGVLELKAPALLSNSSEYSGQILKYTAHLNRALERLPVYGVPGKTKVYRGIYHENLESKIEDRFFKGRVWLEPRFTSTTIDSKVAYEFATGAYKNAGCGGCDQHVKDANPKNMVIISIVHRTGRDIAKYATGTSGEKEILIKSGAIFKVIEAARDQKQRFIVKLEELDPSALSAADRLALNASAKLRVDSILAKEFGNDAAAMDAAVENSEKWAKEWEASGFFKKDDLSFEDEGG